MKTKKKLFNRSNEQKPKLAQVKNFGVRPFCVSSEIFFGKKFFFGVGKICFPDALFEKLCLVFLSLLKI